MKAGLTSRLPRAIRGQLDLAAVDVEVLPLKPAFGWTAYSGLHFEYAR
jgi:hypothetical protein